MRLLFAAVLVLLAFAAPSFGAGVTTHAYMAEAGVAMVQDAKLAALLEANNDALLSGGAYPDGGYAYGGYGEESHWQRFINAYIAEIRSRSDCGDLADPAGPCAKVIAHMLGAAAHGMGDELWDWLFEPAMADHAESPTHPVWRQDLPGFAELSGTTPFNLTNTSEYVMDIIALVDGGRLSKLGTFPPPFDDLLATYHSIKRDDVNQQGIAGGNSLIMAAQLGERSGLGEEYARVKLTMPWSSAHMFTAPGGVFFNGKAIAAYYEAIWHRLITGQPAPLRMANVTPANGQVGVPSDFQPAQVQAGPNGGGSTKRILATFNTALDPATVSDSFRLYDEEGNRVAPMDGFPRMGPYGPDAGEHTMLFYPAADLAPCSTYTAEVTTALADWDSQHLAKPLRWSFETACA